MAQINRREFVAAGAATACLCVLGVQTVKAAPQKGGGTLDVGALSDYPKNLISDKFIKPHKLFVVRNGDQIYAFTAVCTHKACVLGKKENGIKCRCHGSTYSDQGTVTGGPAKVSLFRYAIKLDDQQQHLIVDKSKQFAERQWDDPASFVKVS